MYRRTLLMGAAAVGIATVVYPTRAAADVPRVLFVLAHPDDELWSAVSLREHVDAGLQVDALLLTDGEKSSVLGQLNGVDLSAWWGNIRHDPAAEGYEPLTAQTLADARVREFTNSIACLSAGIGGVTIHRAQLPDGGVTVDAARVAILAVCDQIAGAGPVRLKGHTDRTALDGHPDHVAAGMAMRALQVGDPARFSDLRLYVVPGSWNSPALSTVTHFWDRPATPTVRAAVVNATRCYGAWSPTLGSYAIGAHSKNDWISAIASDPSSLVHT
jgi:hypothetical protein